MSGYLGRLLQTTARNRQRLRPLAGSIFTDSADEMQNSGQEQELGEIERTVVSRVAPGLNAMAHAEEPIGYLENYEPLHPRRREAEADRSGSVESSNTWRTDRDANEQHLERRIQWHGEDLYTAKSPGADADSMRIRSEMDWEGSRADNGPAHADHVTHDAAKNPEIARARGELVSQRTVQPIVTARETVQPSWLQGGPPPQAPRNAGSQVPDVQVHIGRIEVLAVQQQAPATLAPRRERTTSLADYLAGRGGRKP